MSVSDISCAAEIREWKCRETWVCLWYTDRCSKSRRS